MRSAKEATITEHGVIASVGFIEYCQFDLSSGIRNGRETF
jgi:hypothetical protein